MAKARCNWRPDFSRIKGHVARAIADQIEEAIYGGIFQPGDTLPTQRAIADSLGFHLNTVYAAFRELGLRGLTQGAGGRGTIVLKARRRPVFRSGRETGNSERP